MTVEIRKAEPRDAAGIAKVHVEGWQTAYRGMMPDAYLDGLTIEKRTERWKDTLSNQNTSSIANLVVVEDGAVVGFASIGPSRDEGASSNTGELAALYIAPEHWRKKFGTALLNEGLNMLRTKGFKEATLWVLRDNVPGRSFYESTGWVHDGTEQKKKHSGIELNEIRYKIHL